MNVSFIENETAQADLLLKNSAHPFVKAAGKNNSDLLQMFPEWDISAETEAKDGKTVYPAISYFNTHRLLNAALRKSMLREINMLECVHPADNERLGAAVNNYSRATMELYSRGLKNLFNWASNFTERSQLNRMTGFPEEINYAALPLCETDQTITAWREQTIEDPWYKSN